MSVAAITRACGGESIVGGDIHGERERNRQTDRQTDRPRQRVIYIYMY